MRGDVITLTLDTIKVLASNKSPTLFELRGLASLFMGRKKGKVSKCSKLPSLTFFDIENYGVG